MKKALALILLGLCLSACSVIPDETVRELQEAFSAIVVTPTVTVTPGNTGVTLTPTETPTPTSTPTPTATVTPTEVPLMYNCEYREALVECVAGNCSVRYSPDGGEDDIAYNVPYGTRLTAQAVCDFPDKVFSLWYWLGTDDVEYWVAGIETVWRELRD